MTVVLLLISLVISAAVTSEQEVDGLDGIALPLVKGGSYGSSSANHSKNNCYPWMYRRNSTGVCECSKIPYRAVLCDPTIPRTSILDCYCMTYNKKQDEVELGRCVYGCGHKTDTVYYELPWNKSELNNICEKFNKDSTLCGACKSGYSPLVYSFELMCMNCTGMTYNWIKYIAVAYFPLTFFFFFVVVFRFSGTHPLVRGFIAVCQGLVSPVSIRAYLSVVTKKSYIEPSVRVLGSIYGIWNLDFFRTIIPPICLNITPLQALALDYAIAFYPLLLVLITLVLIILHSRDFRIVVWLWKPFHRVFRLIKKDWDLEGSVVKAFATFFLLSYLKILNVTTDLLIFTEKYTLPSGEYHYQVKHALYYDASVEYFKGEHLYFGIVAIIVGIFMVILPVVFLVVYPMRWFQKCLNFFHIQRQSIDTFVNCYQGYYKDGTNGSKDYRCFSITFFLLQFTLYIIFTISRSIYTFSLGALSSILFMFTVLLVQPYKKQFKVYNVIDAFMMLHLSIMFVLITAADEADIKAAQFSSGTYGVLAILSLAPLFYFFFLCIWWIFVKKNLRRKLPCFRVVNSNSVQLQESYVNDDFPDRIQNPSTYETQAAAPLLCTQEHNSCSNTKYGAAPMS